MTDVLENTIPDYYISMDEKSDKEFHRLLSIGVRTKKKRIKKKALKRIQTFLEDDCKWITSRN